MSYRPMVKVDGEWAGNGLRFATEQEALENARNLSQRWTLVTAYGVEQTTDPVNYRWADGKLEQIQ